MPLELLIDAAQEAATGNVLLWFRGSLRLCSYCLCRRRIFEGRMGFWWWGHFVDVFATLFQICVNVSKKLAGVHCLGRWLSFLDFCDCFGRRFYGCSLGRGGDSLLFQRVIDLIDQLVILGGGLRFSGGYRFAG